tara:strand:+ start:5046 stop:5321 length:276 start_codon:yes stop_codon:yes gene_type:complete
MSPEREQDFLDALTNIADAINNTLQYRDEHNGLAVSIKDALESINSNLASIVYRMSDQVDREDFFEASRALVKGVDKVASNLASIEAELSA